MKGILHRSAPLPACDLLSRLRLRRLKRAGCHPIIAHLVHVAADLCEAIGEIVPFARIIGQLYQMLAGDNGRTFPTCTITVRRNSNIDLRRAWSRPCTTKTELPLVFLALLRFPFLFGARATHLGAGGCARPLLPPVTPPRRSSCSAVAYLWMFKPSSHARRRAARSRRATRRSRPVLLMRV